MTNLNTETLGAAMEAAHAPYSFDQPAYSGCYANRAMCMDERHVYTVFDVLMAWPFNSALELGSWEGASSTAFIEAFNRESIAGVVFCEVRPTKSLHAVVAEGNLPSNCRIVSAPSWEVLSLDVPFDFILVDANHDLESVSKELAHIIRREPLCVMAHDTNATRMGYPKAEGAQHLADTLRKHPAYRGKCIEDSTRRRGEETHRGLFFATTSQELYEKARDIFGSRCAVNVI